jgi:hypothetical protein
MKPRLTGTNEFTVDVRDIGPATAKVRLGDADGSGELPCVQLEFQHPFVPGGAAAIAFSAREAEAVAQALVIGATRIQPHERLALRIAPLAGRELRQPSPPPLAEWEDDETPADVLAGQRAAPLPTAR